MVDSIQTGATVALPAAQPAQGGPQIKEYFNPDGSAVPDVVAYHHRPEDIYDDSDQDVPDDDNSAFFGDDGFSFGDFLDIINPLQHIPIVSTIYRAMTGDEISPGARVAGGALFGGPIGLGVAVVNAAVEASTGEDIGDTIMTAFAGDSTPEATQAGNKPAQVAAVATDADPAILAAATRPVSVLPDAQTGARRNSPMPLQSKVTARPVPVGTKLPFGGIGTLPVANSADPADNPVAALLNARSAVPAAGPVPGLGRAPLGRVDRQPAPPLIGTRLSDKLAALAAETSSSPASENDRAEQKRKAEAQPTEPASQPQYVPSNLVPQAMLNTLDRYRQMKKAESDNIPG